MSINRLHWWFGLFILLGITLLASEGLASSFQAGELCKPYKEQGRAGISAAEGGNADRAITLLQEVVDAVPECRFERHGSVAYWLGSAYGQKGEIEHQINVWRQGLLAFKESAVPVDVRLADEFIQLVFQEQRADDYIRATNAYFELLQRIGETRSEWELDRIARHVRLAAWVIPDSAEEDIGLPDVSASEAVSNLTKRTGEKLVAWWRGQDPLPSSLINERVREHLSRCVYVREHYEKKGKLDDRAHVYVRLGSPSRTTTIRFSSIEFLKGVVSGGSRFNSATFHEGRFWIYDHISRSTEFLFVEIEKDEYVIEDVSSMLPSVLQGSFSSSSRGQEEAEAYVRAMKEAYSQLAVYSDRYHTQHQEFANYVMDFDSRSRATKMGSRSAQMIARRMKSKVRKANRQHQQNRDESTPLVYSEEGETGRTLPVSVRHTRFLESDGETRVNLFWSIPSTELGVSEYSGKTFLIGTTVLQRGPDGKRLGSQRRSSQLDVDRITEKGFIRPQMHHVHTNSTEPFWVEVQWDQHVASDDSSPLPEKRIARKVYRSDTLRPLNRDPQTLTMSDLQPMVLPELEDPSEGIEKALPYPFDVVTFDVPLVLYFEGYHLAFGPNDRTHYTVEYGVYDRSNVEDSDRWGKETDLRSTTVTTTNQHTTQSLEEYILVDLHDWDLEGATDLRIVVRIADNISGQTVERSIDFQINDSEGRS